jgi:prophage regulatory protein
MTPVEPLIGSYEIGVMFGVSRQRVYQLTSRPDFPKPVVKLKVGSVWSTADVIKWAESKGRQIEEDK